MIYTVVQPELCVICDNAKTDARLWALSVLAGFTLIGLAEKSMATTFSNDRRLLLSGLLLHGANMLYLLFSLRGFQRKNRSSGMGSNP